VDSNIINKLIDLIEINLLYTMWSSKYYFLLYNKHDIISKYNESRDYIIDINQSVNLRISK
jgi:hypothetical protein